MTGSPNSSSGGSDLWFWPIKILLITIDLLLTIITFGWVNALKKLLLPTSLRSVPVNDDEAHRVDPRYKHKLADKPRENVETLYDLAKDAFARYGSRHCLGTREFLGWKVAGKVKQFGDAIHWRTFADTNVQAHQFGAALRSAGLQPAPYSTTLDQIKIPCRVAIFENTCAEWMIAAIGCFTQSITVTTVYATLGMDAVVEAIVDNNIPLVVCNQKDVVKLIEKANQMSMLTAIVYTRDLVSPTEPQLDVSKLKLPHKLKVIAFDDFVASGDTKAYPPTPPKADTCAVVMYTSGSTGKPKGVIITHRQINAVVAAAEVALGIREGEDVYLAYLPLAHIMELMAEFVMITQGCTLCYADPKSLTSTGAYPKGALEAFSPTLMLAVPKIWDVIRKGLLAKVDSGPYIVKLLVHTALDWKQFAVKHGFDTPLFNKLVFKKFKAAVGGKLRYALSGGGPLNSEVQDFIRVAFGIDFVQGYGLTETCAGISIQDSTDLRPAVAGVPIPSIQVKLVSTPDVGDKAGQPYLSTDRFDVDGNPIFGRGEVVVRGNNISCGYYMEPEKTKEEFKDDGWFHTGDIGQFMNDGSIRIVDRKKNLVKLKGGEYVALEKMEMTYGNSTFVDAVAGGICCYGDGDMDRPVAIMQLNVPVAKKWAKEHGCRDNEKDLLTNPDLYKAVMADMLKEHAKSDLSHLEKLVGVAFVTEHWTPENGCLTAANKLQRREVIRQFDKEFQEVKKKGIF